MFGTEAGDRHDQVGEGFGLLFLLLGVSLSAFWRGQSHWSSFREGPSFAVLCNWVKDQKGQSFRTFFFFLPLFMRFLGPFKGTKCCFFFFPKVRWHPMLLHVYAKSLYEGKDRGVFFLQGHGLHLPSGHAEEAGRSWSSSW